MPFIPPMLSARLEDRRRLADPRYSAEPKLGQYDPTLGIVQRLAKVLGVEWTTFADAGKGK